MKNKVIKQKLIFLAETAHRRIFKEEMSDTMREFLGNLSWSFFGGITAAGIMFVVQVLAGRILGVKGFGQYNSLLSFASALSFFFLLGNDVSSVRYLSDSKYKKDRFNILKTSFILVLIQSIIIGIVFFLFFNFIKVKFLLESKFLFFGIIFSLLLAFKALFDSYLRAFHLIKRQSIVRVIDALSVIIFFVIFYYYLHKSTYYFYAIAMWIGILFFILIGFFIIRPYFGKFNIKNLKLLLNYNKFLIIGSIGGMIMSLERYFIGKYIGINELGLYSAYYTASFLILSNLGGIFMNVFWPSVIKEKNNLKSVLIKLNKIFIKAFPIWFIFGLFFIPLIIFFMGKEYSLNFGYAILFIVSSFMALFFSIFLSILKIDNIKESIIISLVCYIFLISMIVVLHNLVYYLLVQIFAYIFFSVVVQKKLSLNFSKE